MFATAVTDSVCARLQDCGLVDGDTRVLCRLFADQLSALDVADRVARGECRFDAGAAESCLDGIAGLECDIDSDADVLDWLLTANSLKSCGQALACP